MTARALSIAAILAGCHGDVVDPCDAVPALPDADRPGRFALSELGLHRDGTMAEDLIAFEPAHPLWSDGASKRRWLRLPPGARIDTSDMDHWRFPAGAVLVKEFALEGRRIETRIIARTGCGERDVWMGAFVWNDDESDALFAPGGQPDARGTRHDVPAAATCATCHDGEPGRVLGMSAVQQAHAREELRDLLGHPLPAEPPREPVAAAALGYLHGNCGHCHNPHGSARPDTDMNLRLSPAGEAPAERTTVGRPLQYYRSAQATLRVAPGDPGHSALLQRMLERGTRSQMPPLASEMVDPSGIAIVQAWIEEMAPP